MNRNNLLIIFLCIFLVHCGSGSSSPGPNNLGSIPKNWSKYLTAGSVSATLDVYDSNGEHITTQQLSVDLQTGQVSSPNFQVPIGNNYRFVVVFSYALNTGNLIPYAYVDFTSLVDEFSEQFTFSENDIHYSTSGVDPSISADISAGVIPDLDLDDDGWSNWEELRDKVNPLDSGNIPIAPQIQITGVQDGSSSTATITVIGRDNAHVEVLKMLDPICGITVISDTQVSNVDGSVTRTLVVKLDLLSVRNDPRSLQALVGDGVTSDQSASSTLDFDLLGTASKPYFAFTDPEANAEIEGPVSFKGVACSRQPIDVNSLRFLNQEVSGFGLQVSFNSQRGDYDVVSEAVDTTLLPDGVVNISVEVTDQAGKIGQGSRQFKVINDSQLKIASPVGRRWVFGNEQIVVAVKNLPDSNIVVIEGNPNFTLTSSTAGGAVGTLKVSNLEDGTVIPLTLKAIRSDGSEVIRVVEFTVRNRPQVEVFSPKADPAFTTWSSNFVYRIVNVDPNQIFVQGMATTPQVTQNCAGDPLVPGIIICTGEFPVTQVLASGSYNVNLFAVRPPTADETCAFCFASHDYGWASAGYLPNDIPAVNVAIDGDDEFESPEVVTFPSDAPAKLYNLQINRLRTESLDFAQEQFSGGSMVLSGLSARADYVATLRILSGPGGNLIGEMFKNVTTGDLGLVGWWRFAEDPNGSVCPGGQAGETVCDYSGRNNHGIPRNGPSFVGPGLFDIIDGALDFDGADDYVEVAHDGSLNFGSGSSISLEVWFNIANDFSPWVIGKGASGGHGNYSIILYQGNDGLAFSYVNSDQTLLPTYFSGISALIGSWTHSIMSFTFGNGSSMRMRVNNTLPITGIWKKADGTPGATGNESPFVNGLPLSIGRRTTLNQDHFNGLIDEILIYNRSLSDSEMTEHYGHVP